MGLKDRLDRATEGHRLLDHPFYQAWAAGDLTVDDLAFYASQYWRQVEAFPGYLEALAPRLNSDFARKTIEANLADERDDDHPRLWLDFADAVGADETRVRATDPEIETLTCVERFDVAARWGAPLFALGMLYGYESQTPAVAKTKVEGLRGHYGIDGDAVRYFELHADLDVKHSDELVDVIDEVVGDERDLADATAGARAGAAAIEGLLDGVARVRGIAC